MDVLAEIRKAIEGNLIDTRQAIDNCVFTYHYIIIIIIIIINYYYYVSCHRPILPGNCLKPTVIPTAQASSFTRQYFLYYV